MCKKCGQQLRPRPELSCPCSDTIIGFVNSIKTVDGGTHIDGTKVALTRTGANELCSPLALIQRPSFLNIPASSTLDVGGLLGLRWLLDEAPSTHVRFLAPT
jgi:hypothetical protein